MVDNDPSSLDLTHEPLADEPWILDLAYGYRVALPKRLRQVRGKAWSSDELEKIGLVKIHRLRGPSVKSPEDDPENPTNV